MEKITSHENLSQIKLYSEEIDTITLFADIRRKSTEIKKLALILYPESNGQSEDEKLLLEIKRESDGVNVLLPTKAEKKLLKCEKIYLDDADMFQDSAPNYSAYLLGYIAKLKQILGKPFEFELEKSKQLIKPKNQYTQLSDLLPYAQILGITKRQVEKKSLPPIEVLSKIATEDRNSARDIGLVLNEKDREQFISLIPEEKRKEITILMDNELSKILSSKIISEGSDQEQALSVRIRSGVELEKAIDDPQDYSFLLVKYISQSLANLDSEDSNRLLVEIGNSGLSEEKDKNKQKMKLSYVARIVKTVIDIDIAKGSNLAMKFISKRELPDRLFSFFTSILIENGCLTKNIKYYLTDKNNIPFLQRLIATYPNQFNTVVDTLSQIKDYNLSDNQEEIFSAVSDLGSLTPIIFNRYRKADSFGKKELARQVRELKPKFFKNIPIKNILERKDQDILVEMVYLAYKPIGMNFEKVKGFMNTIEDRTEDLKGFSFPESGYDFNLNVSQKITLKEGEFLDLNILSIYKKMLSIPYPEDEESFKKFSSLLSRVAKAGTLNDEEMGVILSIINRDEFIVNSIKRFDEITNENAYDYLSEIKEIFGIYFKDNYKERLQNFLSANPSIEGHLMKIITSPDRQKVLKTKLGKRAEEINWDNMSDKKEIAKLMTIFFESSILKTFREMINRNLNKFITEDGRSNIATQKNLKAYISKNVGSFFAKASAGICTAEDVSLFNTKNHFHINIVERDDSVRANIQAYIIDDNGGKSLLLRGFNPNTNFLDKIDAESFCEEVIKIGKQFQKDNKLNAVYITEQGSWHSLSNREKVATYLTQKYLNRRNEILHSFKISSNHTISYIYKV